MELKTFEEIMNALNQRDVRYLLVGGMAVVAHGYGRLTFDVDLVLQLKKENIIGAFQAFESLGYQPRVPVTAENFADEATRRKWIHEKGMMVLNFYSDRYPMTTVDIFVKEPFDFETTYEKAICADVEGTGFRYVDLQTLIRMKESAGRPVDIEDARHLRILADDEG